MAKTDLNTLVTKGTSGNDKMSKIQIGYTVDAYKGVLSALQSVQENAMMRRDGGSVMGDDYSQLEEITFDNNNFSQDGGTKALWKMEVGLFGALCIKSIIEGSKHAVVKTDNYNNQNIGDTGNKRTMPPDFIEDTYANTMQKGDNFECGVYVDVDDHLVKYFDHFFVGTETVDSNGSFFTKEIVSKLVSNKCLLAQIIVGHSSVDALVIGKTWISNHSRILISPILLGQQQFQSLAIRVNLTGAGKNFSILPQSEDSEYRCETGKSYSTKDGTISGLGKNEWDEWLAEGEAEAPFSISQPSGKTVYVRMYIPADKRRIAEGILPKGVPQRIYDTYTISSVGAIGFTNVGAADDVDMTRLLECVEEVCNRKGLKKYTFDNIRDAKSSPQAFSGNGEWVTSPKNVKNGMRGKFAIPQGWPVSSINQNYASPAERAKDQRIKGHPNQDDSNKPADWIKCAEGRLDSAFGGVLTAQMLSGSMPKEWYQERLMRANLGEVEILCNSAVQNKFQSLFNLCFQTYSEIANMYNQGRSKEQQMDAGEVILRVAPCLCALNGANKPIHRTFKNNPNKNPFGGGHYVGCAFDLDPSNNATTTSKAVNCQRPISKDMGRGYRPWFHYLHELKGGWGGGYRFMRDENKFDAMHMQF